VNERERRILTAVLITAPRVVIGLLILVVILILMSLKE